MTTRPCRSTVAGRRARSDGIGGSVAEPGERAGDRRHQIARDDDPFERSANLRAERADNVPVVGVHARHPVEPIVDRRRLRDDPPEGVGRHAQAGGHANAFDPRKLGEVRSLAANDRDVRVVDLGEFEDVLAIRSPSLFIP